MPKFFQNLSLRELPELERTSTERHWSGTPWINRMDEKGSLLKFMTLFTNNNFMFKTKLAKVILTCLVYGLASALTQRIWR